MDEFFVTDRVARGVEQDQNDHVCQLILLYAFYNINPRLRIAAELQATQCRILTD